MQQMPEQMIPEVGSFDVTVYNAGRHGRHRSSRFTARCDACWRTRPCAPS